MPFSLWISARLTTGDRAIKEKESEPIHELTSGSQFPWWPAH
jgi:hypothetical protein